MVLSKKWTCGGIIATTIPNSLCNYYDTGPYLINRDLMGTMNLLGYTKDGENKKIYTVGTLKQGLDTLPYLGLVHKCRG